MGIGLLAAQIMSGRPAPKISAARMFLELAVRGDSLRQIPNIRRPSEFGIILHKVRPTSLWTGRCGAKARLKLRRQSGLSQPLIDHDTKAACPGSNLEAAQR